MFFSKRLKTVAGISCTHTYVRYLQTIFFYIVKTRVGGAVCGVVVDHSGTGIVDSNLAAQNMDVVLSCVDSLATGRSLLLGMLPYV
jgi:hypothetical protein